MTSIPAIMVCDRSGRLITRDGRKIVEEEEKEEDGKYAKGFAERVLERWDRENWNSPL